MNSRKLISIFSMTALLLVTVLPSRADSNFSEFWDSSLTNVYPMPSDQIEISYVENGTLHGVTNRLEVMNDETGWRSACLEMGKFPCDKESIVSGKVRIWANLIMPVCETERSPDCVRSLTLIKPNGERVEAKFERYAAGISYSQNPEFAFPKASTHALFKAPGVLNAAGTDTYAVEYIQEIGWSGMAPTYNQIKATVVPYVAQPDPLAVTQRLVEGPTVYGTGVYTPQPWNFGRKQIFMEDGLAGKIANFESEVGVELVIHANSNFGGWLRGRISSTGFSSKQISSSQTQLTVSGTSVEVPRIMGRVNKKEFLELTTSSEAFFDRHVGNGVGGDVVSDLEGNFIWLNAIRFASKDKDAGIHRVWMFGTVPVFSNQNCYKTNGIQGLVATNAAVYAGFAPTYSSGFLNYRVGGMHYLPNGEKAYGSYDLVMRSDIVRCLYGLSKGPVSATLTITGEGDSSVSSVVVGEKNGWLSLSAKGFTFSTKTMKVKVSQKKTTITCVAKGKPNKIKRMTGVAPKCPKGFKKR